MKVRASQARCDEARSQSWRKGASQEKYDDAINYIHGGKGSHR